MPTFIENGLTLTIMFVEIFIAVLIAYLFGSVSSAVITCKLMRLPDPRTQGSGNPGTTNVLRIGGKKAAILTLVGDVLKGVIPVIVAKILGFDSVALSLIALAAFLGHLYPVFFRFEGGKGVATAFGCLTALAPIVGLTLVGSWLLMAILFRYSSLAALTAAVLAPIDMWLFTHNIAFTIMTCVITALLFYRHQNNIQNLLTGKESKIGKKSTH